MRMSRTDAAKNRDRVIQTASTLFRAGGYDATGIASLMKASGLTNGAFYKQFESKESLIAEATTAALAENSATWKEVLDTPDNTPLAATAAWYLSDAHLSHREKGCTFATLASEAPRHSDALKHAFEEGLLSTLSLLAEATDTDARQDPTAIRHISRLIGALMLARAVKDPALAQHILDANMAPELTPEQPPE